MEIFRYHVNASANVKGITMTTEKQLHNDPEIHRLRKEWLDYLRQPGRKKTKEVLERYHDNEARCCLGHACHHFGIDRTVLEDSLSVLYDKQGSVLPERLQWDLDMTEAGDFCEPIDVEDEIIGDCIGLNDETDLSMAEIADIIEQQMVTGNMKSLA